MIARLLGGAGAASEFRALAIWLAAIVGVLPRRTRGPATLALAVLLSRAHGFALDRLERTVVDLFSQRSSVLVRVEALEAALRPDAEDVTT